LHALTCTYFQLHRDDFTRVIKTMDFVDSYRHENPTRQSYSFWSYRSGSSLDPLLSFLALP
jgi:exonuclease III